jgi:hypothetical protein
MEYNCLKMLNEVVAQIEKATLNLATTSNQYTSFRNSVAKSRVLMDDIGII